MSTARLSLQRLGLYIGADTKHVAILKLQLFAHGLGADPAILGRGVGEGVGQQGNDISPLTCLVIMSHDET